MLVGNEYFDAHQSIEAPFEDRADYDRFKGTQPMRSGHAIADEALQFIRDHAEEPFFLYYPTIVPHVAIQVPEDLLAEYAGMPSRSTPYLGGSYLPHPDAARRLRRDDHPHGPQRRPCHGPGDRARAR